MSNDFLISYFKNIYFGFQDPGSPIMEGIMDLHNHIMYFLVLILVLVSWLLIEILYVDDWYNKHMSSYILYTSSFYHQYIKRVLFREFFLSFIPGNREGDNFLLVKINKKKIRFNEKFIHSKKFEIIWTLLPGLILTVIAIPSFGLLYASDELLDPYLTIQVEGHQWYWTYEFNPHFLGFSSSFSDEIKIEFDSFLINDEMLNFYVEKQKGFCVGFSHFDFYDNFKIIQKIDLISEPFEKLLENYNFGTKSYTTSVPQKIIDSWIDMKVEEINNSEKVLEKALEKVEDIREFLKENNKKKWDSWEYVTNLPEFSATLADFDVYKNYKVDLKNLLELFEFSGRQKEYVREIAQNAIFRNFSQFKIAFLDLGISSKKLVENLFSEYDFFLVKSYINEKKNILVKALELEHKVIKKNIYFPYLRLLEVDNILVLPMRIQIRFIIESIDVLHCWAVPSLGIKLDAVPGRMNQCSVFIKRGGLFFGQCSEICGTHHGFMPICIESTLVDRYFFYYIDKDNFIFINKR